MQATASQISPNVVHAFIQEYIDAWKGTDEDKILSYYSDDVTIQLPTGTLEGKAAVRDNFVHPFVTAFPRQRAFDPKLGACEENFAKLMRQIDPGA